MINTILDILKKHDMNINKNLKAPNFCFESKPVIEGNKVSRVIIKASHNENDKLTACFKNLLNSFKEDLNFDLKTVQEYEGDLGSFRMYFKRRVK